MHYCASCNKCLMKEKVFFYYDISYCSQCCPWNIEYCEKINNIYLYEDIYDTIVNKFTDLFKNK